MDKPSHRATYSKSQIENYFDYIALPQRHREQAFHVAKNESIDQQLDYLISLQRHQLCNVPFENLAIHYSPHHAVSIDPTYLYAKIVSDRRGRGGYCMENNCFFGTVLRTLGFTVCSVGARVSDEVNGRTGGGYNAWTHMVNLVTLSDGRKYMVDVGFGSDGPTRPLLLADSLETGETIPGVGRQQLRLIYSNIAPNTDPNQKVWISQRRNTPDDEWSAAYCFVELEFLPQDYSMMNFWTSQSKTVFLTYAIVVVKMIMEGEEVTGQRIMFGGEVKKKINGETEHVVTCKSEGERVEALEKWFGLMLTEDERRGIKGMVTELKG